MVPFKVSEVWVNTVRMSILVLVFQSLRGVVPVLAGPAQGWNFRRLVRN